MARIANRATGIALIMSAVVVTAAATAYVAGQSNAVARAQVFVQAHAMGPGADYRNFRPFSSDTIKPVPPAAGRLFAQGGKGPRADFFADMEMIERVLVAARAAEPADRGADIIPDDSMYTVSVVDGILVDTRSSPLETRYTPAGLPKRALGRASDDDASGTLNFQSTERDDGLPSVAPEVLAPRPENPGLPRRAVAMDGTENPLGGSPSGGPSDIDSNDFRTREIACLATAIYEEARGEPIQAQLAVAQTILNRVRSDFYPDSACGVVYQGAEDRVACQFAFACNGGGSQLRTGRLWELATDLATQVANGDVWLPDIGYASHYHAIDVSPAWRSLMTPIKRVGGLLFYRANFLATPVEMVAGERADQASSDATF